MMVCARVRRTVCARLDRDAQGVSGRDESAFMVTVTVLVY